jgi:hypothetical protein
VRPEALRPQPTAGLRGRSEPARRADLDLLAVAGVLLLQLALPLLFPGLQSVQAAGATTGWAGRLRAAGRWKRFL